MLSNAIKHHDNSTGNISVTIESNTGFYQFRIQDDGPGIAPNLHKKALEMFQTLQPRDKVEGSGMGLAMVKRIIEHYGGTLTIDSNGERGTGMIIKWPLLTQQNSLIKTNKVPHKN